MSWFTIFNGIRLGSYNNRQLFLGTNLSGHALKPDAAMLGDCLLDPIQEIGLNPSHVVPFVATSLECSYSTYQAA